MKLSDYKSTLGSVRFNEKLAKDIYDELSLYEVEESTLKKVLILLSILGLLFIASLYLFNQKKA